MFEFLQKKKSEPVAQERPLIETNMIRVVNLAASMGMSDFHFSLEPKGFRCSAIINGMLTNLTVDRRIPG
jgi:hypothetical protein